MLVILLSLALSNGPAKGSFSVSATVVKRQPPPKTVVTQAFDPVVNGTVVVVNY